MHVGPGSSCRAPRPGLPWPRRGRRQRPCSCCCWACREGRGGALAPGNLAVRTGEKCRREEGDAQAPHVLSPKYFSFPFPPAGNSLPPGRVGKPGRPVLQLGPEAHAAGGEVHTRECWSPSSASPLGAFKQHCLLPPGLPWCRAGGSSLCHHCPVSRPGTLPGVQAALPCSWHSVQGQGRHEHRMVLSGRTICEEVAPKHHKGMERELKSSLSLGKREALRPESWIITRTSRKIKHRISIFSTVAFEAPSVIKPPLRAIKKGAFIIPFRPASLTSAPLTCTYCQRCSVRETSLRNSLLPSGCPGRCASCHSASLFTNPSLPSSLSLFFSFSFFSFRMPKQGVFNS